MVCVWREERCQRAGEADLFRDHTQLPFERLERLHCRVYTCLRADLLSVAQIVLYVVSRVFTSLLPRATPPSQPVAASSGSKTAAADGFPHPPGYPYPKSRPPHPKVFELYSALAWGLVMYLFREKRDRLHGGMVSSMQVSTLIARRLDSWRPDRTDERSVFACSTSISIRKSGPA